MESFKNTVILIVLGHKENHMKNLSKLIALLAVLASSVAGQAETNTNRTLSARLEAAAQAAQAAPKDLHDTTVVDMILTVESKWANPINSYSAQPIVKEKPCSAVRIDKNWLMASLTCRGVGEYATAFDHNGKAYKKEIAYRHIRQASIRSKAYHQRDIITKNNIEVDETAQIILLRLNLKDADLAQEVNNVGIAPLLIAQYPKKMKNAMQQAFINRERYMNVGRCSDCVGIKNYCSKNQCYKTEWEFIRGDAGDPLFVSNKQREFLAGFNNAEIQGNDPQSSNFYKAFSPATKQALQRILEKKDPQAWKRVAQQMATSL